MIPDRLFSTEFASALADAGQVVQELGLVEDLVEIVSECDPNAPAGRAWRVAVVGGVEDIARVVVDWGQTGDGQTHGLPLASAVMAIGTRLFDRWVEKLELPDPVQFAGEKLGLSGTQVRDLLADGLLRQAALAEFELTVGSLNRTSPAGGQIETPLDFFPADPPGGSDGEEGEELVVARFMLVEDVRDIMQVLLEQLRGEGGRLTFNEVAHAAGINPNTARKRLARLIKYGYVHNQPRIGYVLLPKGEWWAAEHLAEHMKNR